MSSVVQARPPRLASWRDERQVLPVLSGRWDFRAISGADKENDQPQGGGQHRGDDEGGGPFFGLPARNGHPADGRPPDEDDAEKHRGSERDGPRGTPAAKREPPERDVEQAESPAGQQCCLGFFRIRQIAGQAGKHQERAVGDQGDGDTFHSELILDARDVHAKVNPTTVTRRAFDQFSYPLSSGRRDHVGLVLDPDRVRAENTGVHGGL